MLSMRNHHLYDKYVFYHEYVLSNKSNGAISIYKISESSFQEFILRYEEDRKFSFKIDDLYKIRNREVKIESIQGILPN